MVKGGQEGQLALEGRRPGRDTLIPKYRGEEGGGLEGTKGEGPLDGPPQTVSVRPDEES
jgi:hypothetical protein